ncbi:FAD-binding protein, partial [Candidatus Dependentiae bacterium]|nr:FAD-binding protein [Candidatus Dependentiae bacterium]
MFTKIDKEIIDLLKKFLNSDQIIIDREKFEDYSHDELPGLKFYPELVVFPKNTEEVSRVIKLANKFNFPIIPRGGGSGLTGGAVPVYGGCIISLEKMNHILEIDSDNLMVTVEPGVITGVLQEAVEKQGLFYPPDPASMDVCSIGGNLAEGAGGPRAVKYGTTKDYVVGLEFVTPTGEICQVGGKLVKDAAGYNLIGLLVGSEGTLAIITK